MTLKKLLKKYGKPKVLIDNWDENRIGYACFDFDEIIEWNEKGLFINNQKYTNSNINSIQNTINKWKKSKS